MHRLCLSWNEWPSEALALRRDTKEGFIR